MCLKASKKQLGGSFLVLFPSVCMGTWKGLTKLNGISSPKSSAYEQRQKQNPTHFWSFPDDLDVRSLLGT